MDFWQRLRAWAQLTRLANLPTVWSNALLGRALAIVAFIQVGGHLYGEVAHEPVPMLVFAIDRGFPLFIAVTFFYLAGMILNDLFDLPVDRHDQPERPLPSGRVSVKAAWLVTGTLFLLGLGALSLFQPPWLPLLFGLALVASIVLYDWLHKRTVHAVWLMGLCRALVYLTGAATLAVPRAVFWEQIFWQVLPLAGIIGVYTVMITYIARLERAVHLDARRWLGVAMILLALLPLAWLWPQTTDWLAVSIAGVALVTWLAYALWKVVSDPPATQAAVMGWLAGLCLIDAYLLALIGFPLAGFVAAGCFLFTVVLQRVLAGTAT